MSRYFHLDARLEGEMQRLIGAERFAPYAATTGNGSAALRLHSWNVALASAFLGPSAMVEVSLRNVLSRQLRAAYGVAWYDNPAFLVLDATTRTRENIEVSKKHIRRAIPVRPITEGRVVAEMYLSFWVYLLRPALSRSLWPALQPGFTRYTHRKTLLRYLEPLVPFRNRIAHHEPIFDRHPQQMYEGLLRIADMVSPDLSPWIEHHGRVRRVLADGPMPSGVRF